MTWSNWSTRLSGGHAIEAVLDPHQAALLVALAATASGDLVAGTRRKTITTERTANDVISKTSRSAGERRGPGSSSRHRGHVGRDAVFGGEWASWAYFDKRRSSAGEYGSACGELGQTPEEVVLSGPA